MDDYHTNIDPISKTQLAIFADDPDMFRRIFIEESVPRPAVGKAATIGKVLHGALLEARELSDMLVRIPADCLKSNGSINRARLDAFMDGSDLLPVKDAEYDEIESALAAWSAPMRDMFADADSSIQRESTHDSIVDGVHVKCKPDVVFRTASGGVAIHDIKTSERIDDRAFLRSAREYRYWLQDAHYSGVIGAKLQINPLAIPFRFWTMETRAPYRVHVREYDELSRQRASEEWHALLAEYDHARETGLYEHRRSRYVSVRDWELPLTSDQEITWSED